MDQELKSKWVAALRSGEYLQGTGALKKRFASTPTRHCCIGVLAEVAGLEMVQRPAVDNTVRWSVAGDEGQLVDPILADLGLDVRTQHALITQNDSGTSFDSIAGYIETYL